MRLNFRVATSAGLFCELSSLQSTMDGISRFEFRKYFRFLGVFPLPRGEILAALFDIELSRARIEPAFKRFPFSPLAQIFALFRRPQRGRAWAAHWAPPESSRNARFARSAHSIRLQQAFPRFSAMSRNASRIAAISAAGFCIPWQAATQALARS